VDQLTKCAEAIPIRNHTAPVVARALMIHAFSKFGAPFQILTDRSPEFESELFKQLLIWMIIKKLRTSPYIPSCNAMVERFYRTLNSMLGTVICDLQRDWDERLPLVLAAYTASSHNSTGYSPNQLFLGRMPLYLIMGSPLNSDHTSTVNEFVSKMRVRAEKC